MYKILFESPSIRDKKKQTPKGTTFKPNKVEPLIPSTNATDDANDDTTKVEILYNRKTKKHRKKIEKSGNKKNIQTTIDTISDLEQGKTGSHNHKLTGNLQGLRGVHLKPSNSSSKAQGAGALTYKQTDDNSIEVQSIGVNHPEAYKKLDKRGVAGQNAAKFGSSSFKAKNKKEIKESREFYYYPVNEREKYYYTIEESEQINKNIKQNRVNFLIEQLYIKESGNPIVGMAKQTIGGFVKPKIAAINPMNKLKQKIADRKQGMINKEADKINKEHNELQNKINTTKGTSYNRMQAQMKSANQMMKKKARFSDNNTKIYNAARSLRTGRTEFNNN